MNRKSKYMLLVPLTCFVIALSTGVTFIDNISKKNDMTPYTLLLGSISK